MSQITEPANYLIYLIAWVITVVLIFVLNWKNDYENSGLTIIYIVSLALIHWFSPLFYLLPWKESAIKELSLYGLREATYAVICFGLGNLILGPFFIKLFKQTKTSVDTADYSMNEGVDWSVSKIPLVYFFFAVIVYYIFSFKQFRFPTVSALIASTEELIVVAICFICWQAYCRRDRKTLNKWMYASLLFPIFTILLRGFMGFGVRMTSVVILFATRFIRPRYKILIFYTILVYLVVSFYITYMRDRTELRNVVWGGASLGKRVATLSETLSEPEWFDFADSDHLQYIDERLNQNILVGASVFYLNEGYTSYAGGETIVHSMLAIIPRILWPEKFIYAGSGQIVTKYTGIKFAKHTSVGVGQIMELYINFGRLGIIIGFLILGICMRIFDLVCSHYLTRGRFHKFALWFLPGLAFTNVGGSFVEITATAAAGVALISLIKKLQPERHQISLTFVFIIALLYLIRIIFFP